MLKNKEDLFVVFALDEISCFLVSLDLHIERERSACVTIFQISKSHDMDRKTGGEVEGRKPCFLKVFSLFSRKKKKSMLK